MHRTFYLDGGGSIGADKEGNVYVAWHATSEDAPEGEADRRLWVACSRDDGATFADEAAGSREPRRGPAPAVARRRWSIVAVRSTSSIVPQKQASSAI